jgi:hypothetical protein
MPNSDRHFCPLHRRLFDGSMAGADCPRSSQVGGDTSSRHGGPLHREPVAEPTLLFPRRMIEDALEQAKKLGRAATLEQFETALEALHWILDRGNWHSKAEFIASFDWCAHWWRGANGPIDAEKMRVEYLRRLDRALAAMYRARRSHSRAQVEMEQLSILWADTPGTVVTMPDGETVAAGGCATVALMPGSGGHEVASA